MLDFLSGASVSDVSSVAGGKIIYSSEKKIKGACIDSRKVSEGDLFVAVRGENTDGHNYIGAAALSGASAVLISNPDSDITECRNNGCSVILVADTVKALGLIAKKHKEECNVLTVGVTGSVGKTTTRQYVCAMLSQKYKTHSTDGNFNNELGLPLTLFKLDKTHGAAALELGMSQKGEISYLTNIVRPDIAVITNIGTSHIEFFGSREGIRDAKLEIAEGLKPGGVLLLNGDEPLLSGIENAGYVALKNKNADYYADNIRYTETGMTFDAHLPDRTVNDCAVTTFGEHTVLDAMFAVACGCHIGLGDDDIKKGLLSFTPVGMRQNIKTSGGVTYILDYYNASPESVKASLNISKELSRRNGGRAAFCFGNMLELGEKTEELHRSVGEYAAKTGISLFYAFGTDACVAAEEAVKFGMNEKNVFLFPDIKEPEAISEAIRDTLEENDCILFKASNSVKLGRVAELVLSEE